MGPRSCTPGERNLGVALRGNRTEGLPSEAVGTPQGALGHVRGGPVLRPPALAASPSVLPCGMPGPARATLSPARCGWLAGLPLLPVPVW